MNPIPPRNTRLPLARTLAAGLALGLMAWAATPPTAAQVKKGDKKGDKIDTRKSTFAPEIKPPTLASDEEERALPAPIGDACVGGGGRFIILTIPKERKVAVFDVNEAKVVKYIPVEDDNPSVAASMDKLAVAANGRVERFSLETLEKDGGVTLQANKPVTLLMGSASRGPLIGLIGGAPGFLDEYTLKPVALSLGNGKEKLIEATARISGDGRVITTYNPHSSPQGHNTFIRVGAVYQMARPDNHDVCGHFAPGPEGKYLYSSMGTLTSQGKPVGKPGAYGDGSKYSLPAAEGETFMLRIDVPGFPHGDRKKTGKVYLHLTGDDRPIGELAGVTPPPGLNHWGREKFGIDKRFFLIPSAKLLVTLPESMDRLVLHRVDTDALLEASDIEYLVVTSRPPREVVAGKPFAYEPVVKSKKGGAKLKLETSPKGMKLDGGKLVWDVPAAFAGREVDVTLTASDAGGRETFHSFKIAVRAAK